MLFRLTTLLFLIATPSLMVSKPLLKTTEKELGCNAFEGCCFHGHNDTSCKKIISISYHLTPITNDTKLVECYNRFEVCRCLDKLMDQRCQINNGSRELDKCNCPTKKVEEKKRLKLRRFLFRRG